ncbi:FapA family protein [Bacillus timonensis]|nr:FapA family protein [Bacillus timonensis]
MTSSIEITITKDKMKAYLTIHSFSLDNDINLLAEIRKILVEKNISFGILPDVLSSIDIGAEQEKQPKKIKIAEGVHPVNGKDGYLIDESTNLSKMMPQKQVIVNFRDIIKIPSVKKGQLLAKVVPPTTGIPGRNILNESVPAKDGKSCRVRIGKNTVLKESHIYSTIDGQVSIIDSKISVFPVYEVHGDLDLKVGNIDFIGNVVIHGNIPSGYSIKAGGDIKVYGLVEDSHLEAGGSIYISGGFVASRNGKLLAFEDIKVTYINNGTVKATGNIEVESYILQSYCHANSIVCNGTIIGGILNVNSSLRANEIGNQSHTKTEIIFNENEELMTKMNHIESNISIINQDLSKLQTIVQALAIKYKSNGKLSEEELTLLKRQKITETTLNEELKTLSLELEELHCKKNGDASCIVNRFVYPNVQFTFGKYKKTTQYVSENVKIGLLNKEICEVPL